MQRYIENLIKQSIFHGKFISMQNFLPSVNNYASKMRKNGGLFAVGGPEDDAGGTDGEEGAVVDDATLLRREFHIVDKRARIAVVVLQGVAQSALLVSRDCDGAVVQVDAGVYGLEGAVGGIALLVAADDIVAHPQGEHLLIMEHILDDDHRSATFFIGLLIGSG